MYLHIKPAFRAATASDNYPMLDRVLWLGGGLIGSGPQSMLRTNGPKKSMKTTRYCHCLRLGSFVLLDIFNIYEGAVTQPRRMLHSSTRLQNA